jgi:serine/threonine-protein kinase
MAKENPSQDELAEDKRVGTVAGGYRILSRVGSGTMGHVYQAEDVELGKRVALKVLHKHHQKEFAPRFLREGKTLALLSHPNIVQLVDMGQLDDGALFLATELVAGRSLRELMNEGAIEHRRAFRIVRQLLDALDAAHVLGVVHRDIKPENIMLADGDPPDFVKVLDFGVAKLLADTVAGLGEANLTSVGFSVFGSALYIAPESVTGQPIDARLDLYSVGAVLYEMLTGRPPFDHEDPAALLRMHAFDAPPSLQQGAPTRTFTPTIEQLVARALAKKPEERYRSAADMIAALDAAVASPGIHTGGPRLQEFVDQRPPVRPGLPEAGRQPARTLTVRVARKYRLVIAGAAVAVIAGVVIAFAAVRRSGATSPVRLDGDQLAVRAHELVAAGSHQAAVDLIEHELVGATKSEHGVSYLVLGHARFALGRRLEAVGAYERALHLVPELGTDQELRANLSKVLDGKDSLAVVVTLDLLSSLSPPAHDAIVAYASKGKLADGRHRSWMIAEREGIAQNIDRVESWALDLQQATSCEERKAIIAKLAATSDRRALAALKRARTVKCLEREAADAIARLEAAN